MCLSSCKMLFFLAFRSIRTIFLYKVFFNARSAAGRVAVVYFSMDPLEWAEKKNKKQIFLSDCVENFVSKFGKFLAMKRLAECWP